MLSFFPLKKLINDAARLSCLLMDHAALQPCLQMVEKNISKKESELSDQLANFVNEPESFLSYLEKEKSAPEPELVESIKVSSYFLDIHNHIRFISNYIFVHQTQMTDCIYPPHFNCEDEVIEYVLLFRSFLFPIHYFQIQHHSPCHSHTFV